MGWILSTVLTLGIAAPAAFSYPVPIDVNGEVSRWAVDENSPTITYEVKTSSSVAASVFQPLVNEAAVMWTDVDESYVTLRLATSQEKAQVTVEFVDSVNSDASAGYAQFDEHKDGKPEHCKIKVVAISNSVTDSLSRTVLHELGHCLGLGHSVMPEAVMSYSLDQNGYWLSIDDEAALARLYPEGGDEPRLPPGCSIGSIRTDLPMKKRYVAFLLILPLVFLFYKRLGL